MLSRAMKNAELKLDAIIESGVSSVGLGENVVAERLWKRALEMDAGNITAHMRLAHLYIAENKIEEAGDQYVKMLETDGLPREVFADAAEFFFNNRLYDTAITAAKRFAEEYPGEAIAHVLLASSYNATSRHDDARREVDQAELCAGVSTLKDLVLRQRRWAEHPDSEKELHDAAEEVFGESVQPACDRLMALIARYPDFWEARMLLGIALRRAQRWEEARAQFELVLADRSVPAAEKELTGVYSQLGQPKKALEYARRAFDAQPEDAEIVANYAAALLENDELTDAYKYARRAQMLSPSDDLTRRLIEQIMARSEKRGFLANIKAAAKYVTRKLRRKKKDDGKK
jgi:Tfp pilus assembly protein PilF